MSNTEISMRSMNNNYEIFVGATTTAAQIAAQVARRRAENPSRRVVVRAESPDWRQARAAFVAGASDYLPKSRSSTEGPGKILMCRE